MPIRSTLLLATVFCLMAGEAALAQKDSQVRASIVSSVEAIEPGAPFVAAVSFEMEEGWHIYWRNPGDAGLPTSVEWKLPDGFSVEPLGWPLPHLFGEAPEVTYGYDGRVLLPVRIIPPSTLKAGSVVDLSLDASWLACKEACIPGRATASLRLPVETRERIDGAVAGELQRIVAGTPDTVSPKGITAVATETGYTIRMEDRKGKQDLVLSSPTFLPYYESIVDHSAVQRIEKVKGATLIHIAASPFATARAERLHGVLVHMSGSHPMAGMKAFEVDLPVDMKPAAP